MEELLIAAVVLLSVVVLLLFLLILRSGNSGRNIEMKLLERLNSIQRENDEHRAAVVDALDSKVQSMSEKNRSELAEMRSLLDRELNQHLSSRLHESFSQVAKGLESVQRGIGEMSAIAKDTKALRDILTNVKNRGVFGEILLGKLLSDMLAPNQYVENLTIGYNKTVEFAVKLPGNSSESVFLPIDSKFPIESYIRIVDAEDKVKLEEARKDLYKAIREFAKQIAEYICVPKTTNFALMFLPTEGLYAEAVRNASLVEEVREKYSVIIVGATTLSGFLTSLLVGFQTLAIEQRSMEVWEILSAVKREFLSFETVLQRAKSQMETAEKTIDTLLTTRMRQMHKALREIELPETEFSEAE